MPRSLPEPLLRGAGRSRSNCSSEGPKRHQAWTLKPKFDVFARFRLTLTSSNYWTSTSFRKGLEVSGDRLGLRPLRHRRAAVFEKDADENCGGPASFARFAGGFGLHARGRIGACRCEARQHSPSRRRSFSPRLSENAGERTLGCCRVWSCDLPCSIIRRRGVGQAGRCEQRGPGGDAPSSTVFRGWSWVGGSGSSTKTSLAPPAADGFIDWHRRCHTLTPSAPRFSTGGAKRWHHRC